MASNYLVVVLDRWGRLGERKGKEMRQLFDLYQDAERWAVRRLVEDCEPLSYALIQSTRMISKAGDKIETKITREEAMHKSQPKPRQPAVKVMSGKNARLSFGMHCKQTRVTFSSG